MLRLTRSVRGFGHAPGRDTIILADGLIKIVVERVEGNQVALAIDAPRDISILRAELLNHASPSAQKAVHHDPTR